ncbi:hypothetical protein [Billgrantia kenyensis]|uniref:Lipoprotein n=1 Tax=Billgrantia kenyensis TaxID=321266 RepID=A0A7V9W2R2_9GAMM|nr:hypothetical protein [Halomonas kenyensis]MBA2779930.1 hypothetical protein [Halomonas kenyensis]MCG6662064.1 hypothetical protein [Halomonas kenyensis]
MSKGYRGYAMAGAALAVAGLMAGCGEGNGSASAQAEERSVAAGELESLLAQAESGESILTIEGAVTSAGEYTTAEDPRYSGVTHDVFRPARGGGASRRGSNAEGPYSLTVYTDAFHEDEPDNRVRAWVTLVLPEGAEAGRYYEVNGFSDADDDQVQAHLRGDGMAWTFSRQVEGGLELVELGETISAAWRLEAADGRGEEARRVMAEGAIHDLPLTRQAEAEYELQVDGESEHVLSRITVHAQNNRDTAIIGNGIYLEIPSGIGVGTHPIQRQRGDGIVGAQLSQHQVETLEGELVLTESEEYYDATITLNAEGEDNIQLSGELRRLALGQ